MDIQEVKIEPVLSPRGKEGVIAPEDYKFFDAPEYAHYGTEVNFNRLEQFASYCRQFGLPESRILPMNETFAAMFRYHDKDKPSDWADDHVAKFALRSDPDFARWNQFAGKFMGQKEFADFMADYAKDFYAIDKSAILEIAKRIKVVDQSTMNTDYVNGGLDVLFNSTERATFGDVPMPDIFEIALPIYHGFAAYVIPLRVFWAKQDGKVHLKYEFVRLHLVTDKAFADAASLVSQQTGIKVFGYDATETK